ncbi:Glucose-induced degradation protein 8-like protein, partial [Mucuna pruriens]
AINEKNVHDIILSYLIQNCYIESSESFIACTGMKRPANQLEIMEKRNRILHNARVGNPLTAIDITEQLKQDILEDNNSLLFDLLSLHFIDLRACCKLLAFIESHVVGRIEALEFARTKLSPFGKEPLYMYKLLEFMALLAYENPVESPSFHLLSLEYRQQIVDCLNQTIHVYLNLPNETAMERLIKQALVVRQCLSQEDGPLPFFLTDFLKTR